MVLVLAWPAASVQASAPPLVSAPGLCLILCGSPTATPTPAATQAGSSCLLGLLNCPAPTATPAGSGCVLGLLNCAPANPAANPTANPAPTGPCLLGVLLCGNNVIAQPTPCVAGVLLCAPLPPTPCVAGTLLCPGGVVTLPSPTPGVTPTGTPTPGGGGPPGTNPGATGSGGGGGAVLDSSAVALLRPPGVGLVPRLIDTTSNAAAANADPNPDAYTELLSLSIRDGLRVGGFQLWPLLAALQVILLVVIVGVFSARRVLKASNLPAD
jgi:hypothetical protein